MMRILFAADDSQSAQIAASFLSRLKPPDHLLLLHVVDVARYQHPSMPAKIPRDYYGRLQDSLLRTGHLMLKDVIARFPSDFRCVETSLEVGHPVKTILAVASKYSPDLIALGSRGMDPLQEWFVGGVSYKVASRAKCPVLLIKRPTEKLQKVLLAYDGSDEADRAAEFLERGLFRDQVELTIATVWPEPPAVTPDRSADAEFFMKLVKTAAAELADNVRRRLPPDRYTTTAEMLAGDPGPVLARLARERGMDLVVMGARGLTRLKRFFLGSVSHTVLHQAPCAILIVKQKTYAATTPDVFASRKEHVTKQEQGYSPMLSRSTQKRKEEPPFEQRFNCLLCGKPSAESICEHCKITVQAEAVALKRKIERGGPA